MYRGTLPLISNRGDERDAIEEEYNSTTVEGAEQARHEKGVVATASLPKHRRRMVGTTVSATSAVDETSETRKESVRSNYKTSDRFYNYKSIVCVLIV